MLQWFWSSWTLLIGTAVVLVWVIKLVLSLRKDETGYAPNFPRTFDVWLPLKDELESAEVSIPSLTAPPVEGESASPPAKLISLRIFTGTWNLGDAPPPYEKLREWFVTEPSEATSSLPYDIIAVGAQECSYKARKVGETCELDWAKAVSEAVGGEFELVSASSLRDSIRLLLLVNKRWLNQVHSVRSSTYSTTIPILWRKGGIGVQMSFLGTTFCFISCHLAAHASETTSRNADIAAILKTLGLGNPNFDIGHQFHHCFFMGDLNYRVEWKDQVKVNELIQTNNFAPLLEKDQLQREQRAGNILYGFKEAPINFAPTFKVARGSRLSYDSHRTPSWCDRILTHSLPDCILTPLKYASADSIRTSDHIPVYATFQVSVPSLKISYRDEETLRTFLCTTARSTSPFKTSTPPTFSFQISSSSADSSPASLRATVGSGPTHSRTASSPVTSLTVSTSDAGASALKGTRTRENPALESHFRAFSATKPAPIITVTPTGQAVGSAMQVAATGLLVSPTPTDSPIVTARTPSAFISVPYSAASTASPSSSSYFDAKISDAAAAKSQATISAADTQEDHAQRSANSLAEQQHHSPDSAVTTSAEALPHHQTALADVSTRPTTANPGYPPLSLGGSAPVFTVPIAPIASSSNSQLRRSLLLPAHLAPSFNLRDLAASAEIISKDAEIFELLLSQISVSLEPILQSNQEKQPGLIDPKPRIVLSSSILSIEPIKSEPLIATKEWLWSSIPGALTKPIPRSILAYHHLFIAIYHYKSETSESLLAHAVLSLRDFLARPGLFELPLLFCGVQRGTISGSLSVK